MPTYWLTATGLPSAGFVRQTPAQTMRPESRRQKVEHTVGRVVRQMRELRAQRLAPIQRLAQDWTQSVRKWLGQRLGVERTVTPRERAGEFIAQAQREAQTQRQSRGIRM